MSKQFQSRLGALALLALLGATSASPVNAADLAPFHENFQGYTEFTRTNLSVGMPYNPGVPQTSEGAHETWYGAYFEKPTMSDDVTEDMGVQSPVWYAPNETNAGRFSNDAGLLIRMDTSNLAGATLGFEWHTYEPMPGDRFRAGYFAGPLPGECEDGETGCVFDFSGLTDFWSSWTELVSGNFLESHELGDKAETFALPGGKSELWVAFWMDSDEENSVCPYYDCGLAKIDNVVVQGELVPLPATAWLLGSGLLGLIGFARRPTSG